MKKILSIVLTLALFASHLNVTFGTHLCQGRVMDTQIILGESHLGCGMSGVGNTCNLPVDDEQSKQGLDKVPCCENIFHSVQTTSEFVNEHSPQIFQLDFALVYLYTSINSHFSFELASQEKNVSPTPLCQRDKQIHYQSFLL